VLLGFLFDNICTAQTVNSKDSDHKRTSPHLTIKALGIQNKERILKGTRQMCQCKSKPTRISVDFSTENLKVKMIQNNVLQVLTENNCQPIVSILL
jgi:hypothetical protein